MTQKTQGTPTATVIPITLADPSVPYPEMTGDEPCRQDPDLWFPENGAHTGVPRSFCRTCLVVADCRAWALANPHLASEGVWGGMSLTERNAVRRNSMRRAA